MRGLFVFRSAIMDGMSGGIPRPIAILIVDDDQPFNRAVEARMHRAGFNTATAGSGEEAIKKFGEKHFDLVILDLVMPGMTGFDVIEEIRKRDAKVPIAVLSLLHQEEDVERVTALGATAYFLKTDVAFVDKLVKYAEEVSVS